jgi:hypothetical protein
MTAGVSEGAGWRRVRVGVGISFSIVVVGACFLAARRITTTDWPLQQTNVALVLGASAAYLFGGPRLDLDTIALSIVLLGLVDAVAMLPLAIAAIATSENVFLAPLIVVLLFCLGCSTVLALGPRLVRLPFVDRSDRVLRSFKRVGDQARASRATFVAGAFLFGCWSMRALACTLLLSALGAGFSPSFAPVVICLAAATSILPLTAGGALVNIGATSVVLLALGVTPQAAINFSLASGMLLTFSALAAATVGAAVSLLLTVQRRHLAHAALA